MRKSTKSRLGLALLCAVALVLLMSGSAGAETTGVTGDGFEYSISGNAATITGYIGTATAISIPANIERVNVKSIGISAFKGNTTLQIVSIPSGVTTIGVSAFNGCSNLTGINMPSSITSLGVNAFYGCSSLTSVIIPSSMTSIGERAFADCISLTSVNIPSSVTKIESGAFSGCSNLTFVNIPSSVTSIGNNVFSNCSGLTSVNIPSGVTSISQNTFSGCSSLTSVTIPSSVTSIGNNAFSNCSSLTSVNIPASVTIIGGGAFMSCSRLTSVSIPLGVTSIWGDTFRDCSSLSSVSIPSSVTSIGLFAFRGCGNLTSVNIPTSVINIGEYAFAFCNSISSLTIPLSVTNIGNQAFYNTAITLKVYPGSMAESYAISNNISHELLPVIHVTSITLDKTKLLLSSNDIISISAEILPTDATISALNWTSSDTSVAMVTTNGQVMAVGLGTAIITATAMDGSGVSATCSVIVMQPITSITVEPVSVSIDVGDTQQLTAIVSPDNASNKTIKWSSGNISIVTVDLSGLVTAIVPGTITITSTAQDGSEVSGSVEITVNKLKYDMSGAKWNYTAPFTHDGAGKMVELTGLPDNVTPVYTGNAATDAGTYIASATFTYDTVNYEAPVMPDLTWAIELAANPKLPGDATGDASIDIMDLVSIIDHIVSGTQPGSLANADANGDGTVDIMDLVWIIDQIVGG